MTKRVFLIAGEPSGDALGASLMCGLKELGIAQENIEGIGGGLMQAEGLESLLPMEELCVMGLWEVLWQLPRLLKLIHGVVEEIEKRQPDIVVTIDLPDFNFQVAQKLKKRGIFKGKIVHYVAPTVWAWRPGRAKKVSEYLDGMMCLFPFEPTYFEKHGLKSGYVGHPLVEHDKALVDPIRFRKERSIGPDDLCVGLLLGSREKELSALSSVFIQTLDALYEQYPEMQVIVPTLPNMEYEVLKRLEGVNFPVNVVTDQGWKWDAFAACDVALAVSGTVGLELSYIGTPHVIGYKAHPITGLILKLIVKTRFAHLTNILLDEEAVPEFLQGRCNVNLLTRAVMRLIKYPEERQKQTEAFAKLDQALMLDGGETPSRQAARFVLDQ